MQDSNKWLGQGAPLAVILVVLAGAAAWVHHRETGPMQATPAAPRAVAGPVDFHGEPVSPDVHLMADWVAGTHDNQGHAFIFVDKKDARVYVFSPSGQLAASAPALLAKTRADVIPPGTGDKSLAQMTDADKVTPAGRFVAKIGQNADDEDVIWVDYDDAISMHRVRPKVASERRLERLASRTIDDNRISFGCINLPVAFYEDVAKPQVMRYGAVVYVLPEVKTVQEVFGAYDVTDPAQLAAAPTRASQG